MPRRRLRSSRESILRETPTWSTVGMNTRNRPGIVACEVRRAPFVPSGSLATWTMISWPSFRSSSIFGSGPLLALAVAATATPAGPVPPERLASPQRRRCRRRAEAGGSSSSVSRRSNSSKVATTSET